MSKAIAVLDMSGVLSNLMVPMGVVGVGGPSTIAYYNIDTSKTREEMLADIKDQASMFLASMDFAVDAADVYVFGAPQ